MSTKRQITVDGNEAAASVAYRLSEAIAIFPITPSSPMAELCDEWANRNQKNLWGVIPEMAEMQSEGAQPGLCTALSRQGRWQPRSRLPRACF